MIFQDLLNNMPFLLTGLKLTALLSVISIIGSLVLGVILGVIRYSKMPLISHLALFFIEVTRSIPLILFIIFIHFTISPYLYDLGVFKNILGFSSLEFQSACIAIILFTSAYVAEIVRSGLRSIEKSYIDAAKSLGFNSVQRLFYVILPISLARMTPALAGQFISLVKDTSLASTIGLIELTRAGEIVAERTYNEFEVLLVVAFMYFVICYGLSLLSKRFEVRRVV